MKVRFPDHVRCTNSRDTSLYRMCRSINRTIKLTQ